MINMIKEDNLHNVICSKKCNKEEHLKLGFTKRLYNFFFKLKPNKNKKDEIQSFLNKKAVIF